jgi:hypothetical protein
MSKFPVPREPVGVPVTGKGARHIRGSVAQRRAMYEMFRAHTEEARDRLLEILRDPDADNGHVIQAAKEILNRGWGAAPQIQVIEEVFRHEVSFNVDKLRQLPSEQLTQLEATLARLIEVEDAEVIEHRPTTTNESASHAPTQGRNESASHAPTMPANESAGHAPEPPRRRIRRSADPA